MFGEWIVVCYIIDKPRSVRFGACGVKSALKVAGLEVIS